MSQVYSANGKIRTTTVNGLSRVPLYAADNSVNIVLDDIQDKGIMHRSGAMRVNSGTSKQYYDPSGAVYSNRLWGVGKA